jgi:hypothetical protein
MPTLEVETNVCATGFERRVARDVAMWLHGEGVPLDYSILKFQHLSGDHVVSGPFPFDRFPSGRGPQNFAFVTCYVAGERPHRFRTGLVAALTSALGPEVSAENVFVLFRSVTPDDFMKGAGRLQGADDRG